MKPTEEAMRTVRISWKGWHLNDVQSWALGKIHYQKPTTSKTKPTIRILACINFYRCSECLKRPLCCSGKWWWHSLIHSLKNQKSNSKSITSFLYSVSVYLSVCQSVLLIHTHTHTHSRSLGVTWKCYFYVRYNRNCLSSRKQEKKQQPTTVANKQ